MKTIALFTINIKSSGANIITNGILSIGFCVGTLDGILITKARLTCRLDENIVVEPPNSNYVYHNEGKIEYFRRNNDTIFELVEKEGRSPLEQIRKFAAILDEMDERYNLKIITDNPAYDVTFLDYYFAKYLGRHPMAYKYNGEYRNIYCTDTYSSGLLKTKNGLVSTDADVMQKLGFSVAASTSHLPEDHAEYIFKFHTSAIRFAQELLRKSFCICVIDVETFGANILKNGIASIGVVVGDVAGNVHTKKRFSFGLPDGCEIEERCRREFWNHHPRILKIIQQEQVNPALQIANFAQFMDALDREYHLKIVNDNVALDLGYINFYFAKYLNRNPLTYRYDGMYRNIYAVDDYSRGLLHVDYNVDVVDQDIIRQLRLQIETKKTHLPDDDAEYIYNFHVALLNN